MNKEIELLAPGGDIDSIKAAILAGADAVYCGLNKLNARNRATNIDFEDLQGILNLAHGHGCKIFLTLNILIMGSEIPYLIRLLNKLVNTRIDGVIVQDFGLFYLLSKYFKGLEIHASTQMNTHNEGQIKFLKKLSATRVNLSRELNIHEIKDLSAVGHQNNMLTEVFVHGSHCLSFSGICYMSSVHGGNSGNRGRCSQPCRDRYLTTAQRNNFPLNLKDNSAYSDLKQLADAGVFSLKIEGRIKKFDYVYTVVSCWKKQIQRLHDGRTLDRKKDELYKVFNRDFSNGYLKGNIHKNMFIDNPKDYSIRKFSQVEPGNEKLSQDKIRYYDEKDRINARVREGIKELNAGKFPLTLTVSGKKGERLKVSGKTPETTFVLHSKMPLSPKEKNGTAGSLNHRILTERLSILKDTGYYIQQIEVAGLQPNLFIPFNALSAVRKKMIAVLNDVKEIVPPIDVPFLNKEKPVTTIPRLSVLISSHEELHLIDDHPDADIFFQLPNRFTPGPFIRFFRDNIKLIPFFPSVLIGDAYTSAKQFLEQVRPERIVTDNTGIAYEAYKNKIPWIAGPHLNCVNSFSLLCLKEKFDCAGAFISNELSKHQIKRMIKPADFDLYYSIYHPLLLMTSRQCLLHQVTGCEKDLIDEDCIQSCQKFSSIINLKKEELFIKKTKGNYHCLYNNKNFFNPDIVDDLPGIFSGFLIDLRDIRTDTRIVLNKSGILRWFENLLSGDSGSREKLEQFIYPRTSTQYKKGI